MGATRAPLERLTETMPDPLSRKLYPNKHEDAFASMAHVLGWEVSKRGWPDFICWDGDEAIFVEVKPKGRWLRESQHRLLHFFASKGIPCFVSDGYTMIPFDPDEAHDVVPDDDSERTPPPSSNGKLRRGS